MQNVISYQIEVTLQLCGCFFLLSHIIFWDRSTNSAIWDSRRCRISHRVNLLLYLDNIFMSVVNSLQQLFEEIRKLYIHIYVYALKVKYLIPGYFQKLKCSCYLKLHNRKLSYAHFSGQFWQLVGKILRGFFFKTTKIPYITVENPFPGVQTTMNLAKNQRIFFYTCLLLVTNVLFSW